MVITERNRLWRDVERDTAAASYLLNHADCNGPLSDLPTAHPAVRVIMAARRHLLNRARRARRAIFED